MASSNRHWPSMFKSKPHHHQWQQHDINPTSLMSTACSYRTPNYTSAAGPASDERSPEPKPRWNPKPEQIRILEAIFNSGMVNPPRDEIRKIRAQLQEYGQVGDANVFYWFQNRKSRSKHKLRTLQNSSKSQQHKITTTAPPSSSSSSSSDKSSPNAAGSSKRCLSSTSPTGSVNQTYNFQQPQNEFVPAEPPFFFPAQQQAGTQGFCFSELSNVVQIQEHHPVVGPCTSLLLNEIMNSSAASKKEHFTNQEKNIPHLGYTMASSPIPHHTNIALASLHSTSTDDGTVTVASTINQFQGEESAGGDPVMVGAGGAVARSSCMVFINDVAIEVSVGPFNVREAFGDDVLLIHSSGQPVVTNEWGVTLHPLHHGAFYYLVPLSITEHLEILDCEPDFYPETKFKRTCGRLAVVDMRGT